VFIARGLERSEIEASFREHVAGVRA